MNPDSSNILDHSEAISISPDTAPSIDVSIVVPLYDEEQSVIPLCRAIREVMVHTNDNYEVILVDDGSRDATFEQARDEAHRDDHVRVIKLTRNFGQTAALKAGFQHARGGIIVTMDGDLQNDPADLPTMLRKIDEGFDMVVGWRVDRKDALMTRKIPSRIANWIIRKIAGTTIRDNGCAIRAYRSDVVRDFPLYSEMHRLLPTMLAMSGAAISEVPVAHHERRFGESKYGLARTYKVLLDMIAVKSILTFHRSPLFGFGIPAILSAFVGLALLVAGTWMLLAHPEAPSLVYPGAAVLFIVLSISFVTMGILGELVYSLGDVRVVGIRRRRLDS